VRREERKKGNGKKGEGRREKEKGRRGEGPEMTEG
jgi:hypothetical protein